MPDKQVELALIRKFAESSGLIAISDLQPSEEPDALLNVPDGRVIGIEVTRLYKNEAGNSADRPGQEAERRAIVARAQQIAESAGAPPVMVSVGFSRSALSRLRRNPLAALLTEAVLAELPSGAEADVDKVLSGTALPPGFRSVRVLRQAWLTHHHWHSSEGGWVQFDFTRELQAAIEAKNRRLKTYREQCAECWLLVVALGYTGSSLFEPSESTRLHEYRSAFARSFFMEYFSGRWFELTTRTIDRADPGVST